MACEGGRSRAASSELRPSRHRESRGAASAPHVGWPPCVLLCAAAGTRAGVRWAGREVFSTWGRGLAPAPCGLHVWQSPAGAGGGQRAGRSRHLLFCGCSEVGRLLIGPISCMSRNVHDFSRASGSPVRRTERAPKQGPAAGHGVLAGVGRWRCHVRWESEGSGPGGGCMGPHEEGRPGALRSPPLSCPRRPCRCGGLDPCGSWPARPRQTGL